MLFMSKINKVVYSVCLPALCIKFNIQVHPLFTVNDVNKLHHKQYKKKKNRPFRAANFQYDQ